jgi:hypothetical protein
MRLCGIHSGYHPALFIGFSIDGRDSGKEAVEDDLCGAHWTASCGVCKKLHHDAVTKAIRALLQRWH